MTLGQRRLAALRSATHRNKAKRRPCHLFLDSYYFFFVHSVKEPSGSRECSPEKKEGGGEEQTNKRKHREIAQNAGRPRVPKAWRRFRHGPRKPVDPTEVRRPLARGTNGPAQPRSHCPVRWRVSDSSKKKKAQVVWSHGLKRCRACEASNFTGETSFYVSLGFIYVSCFFFLVETVGAKTHL